MVRSPVLQALCATALILAVLPPAGSVAANEEAVFSSLEGDALAGVLKDFRADVMRLVRQNEKFGNFATSMGKDRWLFYGDELKLKASTAKDYLKAVPSVVDLHEQLKSVGVELIYVPITPKWAIYPDAISDAVKPDARGRIPRVNPESRALFEELRARGVTAVDLTEPLVRERYGEHGPVHFKHDTHWSPAGMVVAARAVAEVIRSRPWYRSIPKLSGMRTEWRPVEREGDLRIFLRGTSGDNDPTAGWPIETRDARYVFGVEKRDDALAVVIGDSNVAAFPYEFNFSAQLAYELKMHVDEAATPVEGCRRMLGRRGYKDPAYLLSKKVVIWLHTGRNMASSFLEVPVVNDTHRRLHRNADTAAGWEEESVLQAAPYGLWPLDDPWGPIARNLADGGHNALYEPGVELGYVSGADGERVEGRAAVFTGGRVLADLPKLRDYSVELWLRHAGGEYGGEEVIWSIGEIGKPGFSSDSLSLHSGTLVFSNGPGHDISGKTKLEPNAWYHVALVRKGGDVFCYLNGDKEFSASAGFNAPARPRLYLGGRPDKSTPWHGKLSEAAFYTQALTSADVARHFDAWLPKAVARRDLVVETAPEAGLDSLEVTVKDVDDSPAPTTVLSRIVGRSLRCKGQTGRTLTLQNLAPGSLELRLCIEFIPLGGVRTAETACSLRVVKNTAAVNTDVTWSGGSVLPSGRTATEWWRGRNWQGKRPPQRATSAEIIFESNAAAVNSIAFDRSIGGLVVRGSEGIRTTDLGGKTLTVNGDLSIDLPPGQGSRYSITNGTLQLGSRQVPSNVNIKNGTLHLDAMLDMANVGSIMVPDNGGSTGTLVVTGAGAVSADRLHIASAATEEKASGCLRIPKGSKLEKITVKDSFLIAAAEMPEWQTSLHNGYEAGGGEWRMPNGLSFEIGSTERPAERVAIGHGLGWSKRGSLVAGEGGTFSANTRLLQVGTMSGAGMGWRGLPQPEQQPGSPGGDETATGPASTSGKLKAESIDPRTKAVTVQDTMMQLDAAVDKVDVESIAVSGTAATLIVNGPKVLTTDSLTIASGAEGKRSTCALAIPQDSGLARLVVRDSLRIAASEDAGFRTSMQNGYDAGGGQWRLPPGMSFEIGSPGKPARTLAIGHGRGWSKRGVLVAGAGGTFTANVNYMQVGTMSGKGTGWWGAMQPEVRGKPPYGVGNSFWGTLDLSRMDRCDIKADTLRVGHTAEESWGTQLIGKLLLPEGNVKANTVIIGQPFPVSTARNLNDQEWDSDAFRAGTEGRLELKGTKVEIRDSISILNSGVVVARVSGESCGLDLAGDATLSIRGKGKLNIVFQALPIKRGRYYGFRWQGDHRHTLERMLDAGAVTVNSDALPTEVGKAAVFVDEEQTDGGVTRYTYIGFLNAPDNIGNNFWGTLDISRMDECDITADSVQVGYTDVESWGTQLIGRLLLPRGKVSVRTAEIGHSFPVSAKRGSDAFRLGSEGRLGLHGTVFKVSESLAVLNTGIVETRVWAVSSGLDLAAGAGLAIEGDGVVHIEFLTLPKTAGRYYGLRWRGDHRRKLEGLIRQGRITINTDALGSQPGAARVFTGEERVGGAAAKFTYIGFPNAPAGKHVTLQRPHKATREEDTAGEEKVEKAAKTAGAKDGKLTVRARIAIVSKPPVPHAEPYADALTTTLYKVVKVESGSYGKKQFLAIEPVMKNYKLLPSAKYKVGEVKRLVLIPWEKKKAENPKLEQVWTVDDTNDYTDDIFWAELTEQR